ncbi:hypothetical protein BJY04DRAFT_185451 [Aspergillus karnatakaensis]|uniref:uncharacterized protein n=1 Tax=Aspergillus karnatakaensis TaxID=1810916 RepID=UPI003CCCAFDD
MPATPQVIRLFLPCQLCLIRSCLTRRVIKRGLNGPDMSRDPPVFTHKLYLTNLTNSHSRPRIPSVSFFRQ